MKFSKKFLSRHLFLFALLLGVTSAIGISVLATTVGNNVSVSGTLSSSGNATFSGTVTVDGNSTFGNAGTDVNLFTGTVQASTTALFTSGLTAYSDVSILTGGLGVGIATTTDENLDVIGSVSLGNAVGDTVGIRAGGISMTNSGTTTIIAANTSAWSIATSTTAGQVPLVRYDTANTRIGIGTSTPARTLAIGGDSAPGTVLLGATTGATSTLVIDGVGASRGSCINMRATNGTMIRIYATTTPATSPNVNNGTGLSYQNLIVEVGACQ